MKQYYCIDCNKEIGYEHTRCRKCAKQGKLHSLYGRKHSEETKNKIRIALKGKKMNPLAKNHIKRGIKKYFCVKCNSEKSRTGLLCFSCSSLQHSNRIKLENNPNWAGGTSFEPYPLGWNNTFREQIRYRDEYKCQVCHIPETETGRKLSVHHIDYNKNNLSIDNLISLCARCHCKTNPASKRDMWIEYFKGILCVF